MDEYARVIGQFGYNVVELGLGKVYLKHGAGDRCIFQHPSQGRWVCALQRIKPLACKLFPFRVHSQPVYRRGDRSGYRFRNRNFYVYLDPACPGIEVGKPSERFFYKTLPEVVEIGMGLRWKQKFTTSKYF
jgi:Fe-S-cluster containining protein